MLSLELEELLELNPPKNEKEIQDLLIFIREWLYEVIADNMRNIGFKRVPKSQAIYTHFIIHLNDSILYVNRIMNVVKKNTNTNYWSDNPLNGEIEILTNYLKKHLK